MTSKSWELFEIPRLSEFWYNICVILLCLGSRFSPKVEVVFEICKIVGWSAGWSTGDILWSSFNDVYNIVGGFIRLEDIDEYWFIKS